MKQAAYDEHLKPEEIERLAQLDEQKRAITREKKRIRQRLRARHNRKKEAQTWPEN